MRNYRINNNTIALKKFGMCTLVYENEKILKIDKSIRVLLEENCNIYGSTLEGRQTSVKKLLNIKYRIPIVVSITNKFIFIPMNSFRNKDYLIIMLDKIINYENTINGILIICTFGVTFNLNIKKYTFETSFLNAIFITNILYNEINQKKLK